MQVLTLCSTPQDVFLSYFENGLKKALDDLAQQDIITPVKKPTPWISFMVVVPKKDRTLHIYLDPKDLS